MRIEDTGGALCRSALRPDYWSGGAPFNGDELATRFQINRWPYLR